jgi:hypothetical protein
MRSTLRLGTTFVALSLLGGAALADGSDIQVGAGLELNYTYNFNRPANFKNTFLFNTKDSQFSLNLGEIHLSREATTENPVGFRVSLIDGQVAQTLLRDGGFNASNPNVLEAYGSTRVRDNVLVQVGQFLSGVGSETPKVGDGQFFSRSFQFQYLQPIFGAGIRAIQENDGSALSLAVTNRFQGVEDKGNRDPFYTLQYKKNLGDKASVTLTGLTGRENLGGTTNRTLSLGNLVYNRTYSEETSLGADLTLRAGKETSGRNYNVSGIGGFLVHKLSEDKTLGLRGEYLSQSTATAGVLPSATGSILKPTLSSITASVETSGISKGLRTLFEFRMDRSSDAVFPGRTGSKKQQNTLTVGQTIRF